MRVGIALDSRCFFQTEYLRRLMTSSLEAFPECWQPLNWSRFEETLQEVVVGQDNLALNARATYLHITLDCLEASRRRYREQQVASDSAAAGGAAGVAAASPLPQLFLGAGGDRDGRTALKRCSQWAAKVWAQRHSSSGGTGAGVPDGGGISAVINARVCMAASRALAEALEAFSMVGGAGAAGVSPRELEGCQLAAVEIESHAEVVMVSPAPSYRGAGAGEDREATARCRAGLMRSLGGRPFCPTLAGILLQNMPPAQGAKGGVAEVERLKALLGRQQAGGNPAGSGSGGGGVRARGRGGAPQSGSAMLLADMVGAGGNSSA